MLELLAGLDPPGGDGELGCVELPTAHVAQ